MYLFDESLCGIWSEFLPETTILAFDFDGTLAPIVTERDAASMRPDTLRRFKTLCNAYRCAVITGRSRNDVVGRLGSAAVWRVVGNHGIETELESQEDRCLVADARKHLERELDGLEGVELEDKRLSLAIHFRKAKERLAAISVIEAALLRLPVAMRRIDGKAVINLVPEFAPHKGTALIALRREAGAERALYVGDDITDEDVFELKEPSWLTTVRIGHSIRTDADYYLHDQSEIDRLLEKLLQGIGGSADGGAHGMSK